MVKGQLKSIVMFIIACFTSPCCTPLIVPLVLTLIAGTPAALWLSQNLGWVYGVLTLISLISLMLALRWMGKRNASQSTAIRPSDIPVISSLVGERTHVE